MSSGHIVGRGPKNKQGKPTGPYSVVLELGSENGKRKQRWFSGYATKTEAQDELIRMLRELKTGQYIDPDNLSVGAWLDRWLGSFCIHLSPYTLRGYEGIVEQAKAEVGDVPLQKLNAARVQQMVAKWQTEGTSADRGPLAATTVRKSLACLSAAFNKAVELEMLRRNPMKGVVLPRVVHKELGVLDLSATQRLLREARQTPIYIPVLLAVTTGMRRGEIVALRWQDVDLEGASLVVRRNAIQVGGKVTFKQPKTNKSRPITISPFVIA